MTKSGSDFFAFIIPPKTKFRGVYRSELVGWSVCLSFDPSVISVRSPIQVVFIRCSPNLVRCCIKMMSRSSLNMGHAGSKTRSRGHLVCFKHLAWSPLSNSSSFHPSFTKLGQKLYLDDLMAMFEHGPCQIKKLGHGNISGNFEQKKSLSGNTVWPWKGQYKALGG